MSGGGGGGGGGDNWLDGRNNGGGGGEGVGQRQHLREKAREERGWECMLEIVWQRLEDTRMDAERLAMLRKDTCKDREGREDMRRDTPKDTESFEGMRETKTSVLPVLPLQRHAVNQVGTVTKVVNGITGS